MQKVEGRADISGKMILFQHHQEVTEDYACIFPKEVASFLVVWSCYSAADSCLLSFNLLSSLSDEDSSVTASHQSVGSHERHQLDMCLVGQKKRSLNSEMRIKKLRNLKITLIVILIVIVTFLHYSTHETIYYYFVFYGELYFLPIVLAGFWLGIRAALITSLGITVCYTPYIAMHWQGFSLIDFDRILSLALYNLTAIIIGVLKEREVIANEKLLKVESLAAMGKSLAAVAHDIKTPLVVIGGFARRLEKKFTKDDPNHEKLNIIIQETEHLEKMMHNMLDFSKPLALHLSNGDINEIVEESTAIITEKAQKQKVTINRKFSSDLPLVAFDATRIKEVIINLAMNAVEESPEGGIVTLRTSGTDSGVIIDVVDCGNGLPPELRKQVFDPFFTTKKEGTGLGLAIVKKIVEAHKGSMELIDNSPKGIIFRIVLPKSVK